MKKYLFLAIIQTVLFVGYGCGDDDDNDTDTDSDSDTDGGLSVEVTYNEVSDFIALEGLETATIDTVEVVLLKTIITEYDSALVLADIQLDFEGSDGFNPEDSENCTEVVPLVGTLADQGGVNITNRDLVWTEEADLPGCMGVGDLAAIHISDL